MAAGYKFKIVSFQASSDSAIAVVKNVGIAPFYYDAYISVDGKRSPISLKLLAPGEEIECPVSKGGTDPQLEIESDRLVEGQSIGFLGTENFLSVGENNFQKKHFQIMPTVVKYENYITVLNIESEPFPFVAEIFDINGNLLLKEELIGKTNTLNTSSLKSGMYLINLIDKAGNAELFKIIVQ